LKYFDAHFHIIDKRFPLIANNGYLPENFSCENYLDKTKDTELIGGTVVSGSFQVYDQSYLIEALNYLGSSFVGVTQLPETVSDNELIELNNFGIRGLRFNVKRGGSENIKILGRFASRVYETVGWHVELYIDSFALASIFDVLISLPSISIDHMGLTKNGFRTLLKLAEKGIKIKASGFGRVDFDVKQAIRDIHSANPNALMFGTDLPSTRAPRPFSENDKTLILEALGERQSECVFYKNAVQFYRQSIEIN